MSELLDQQFIVHLYAPAEGPDATAAYRALTRIWSGCRLLFGLTEPVPGTGLRHHLPPHLPPNLSPHLPPHRAPAVDASRSGGEVALAAQERPGADCQAVLRRHHDVLNLSIALAPPEASAPVQGEWAWWRTFDAQWGRLADELTVPMLGEVRLYLARKDDPGGEEDLESWYGRLRDLLPTAAQTRPGWTRGVSLVDGVALWETANEPDERALRRFVVGIGSDCDPVASSWMWSAGDTAIPPLARYLLHAAKIRYELRVLERDDHARGLAASLHAVGAQLRRLGADGPAQAELLRVRRLDALLLRTDLRAVQRTVEIAVDNLGRAVDRSALLLPGGPFADDAGLAGSILERLDDELAYLDLAADRAEFAGQGQPGQPPAGEPRRGVAPAPAVHDTSQQSEDPSEDEERDRRRDVFVIHGRDEPARRAVFEFLRSLGLRPLEWEHQVALTGSATPSLADVVARAMPLAQAVVVLMTPDDVVRLHPDLVEPSAGAEATAALQARPNVLLELGMALAIHPRRTLVLLIGEQRPVTDLGGLNYIRLAGSPDFRAKIANRLRLAGCPVDTAAQDWLSAGDFGALTAHHRGP